MGSHCKNYYRISRENVGLTQEEAAERLYVSVRSLSDYETGKTVPPDDVVMRMVRTYKTKILGWWHLRNTSELARESLPDVVELQTDADMFLQAEFADDEVLAIKKLIKIILADGEVTNDELEEFERLKNLSKSAAAKLMAIHTYKPNF